MKRQTVFKLLVAAMIIVVLEIIGSAAIAFYSKDYNQIRKILLGKEEFVGLQNMISQAYLLYVPSPNLEKYGYVQHNKDGYRGKQIPLIKDPGSYRILFLGGSTTYSMWVNDPDSTYPAQIGHLLEKRLNEGTIKRKDIEKIEVINGGLPWGTSAEILAHYCFKLRYYDPDLVVINTGGNDAYAHFLGGPYQPDYGHFRKSMTDVHKVKDPFRWLFYSRLFSFIFINIFQDDLVKGGQFVHDGESLRVKWFDNTHKTNPITNLQYNAFYRNISSAIREIKSDSAEVMLVPFLGDWNNEQYTDTILEMHHLYNDRLRQIADEQNVNFVPFGPNVITDQNYWMDDCHLNEEGVQEKALHLSPYIIDIINKPTEIDTLQPISHSTK